MIISQRMELRKTFFLYVQYMSQFVNNKYLLLLKLSQTEIRKFGKKLNFLKAETF